MKNAKNNKERGITLIALVVTIVVLIILATISINAAIGNDGLIAKAKESKNEYEKSKEDRDSAMKTLLNDMATDTTKENSEVSGEQKNEESGGGETNPPEGVNVIINGETITITEDNVGGYLGKIVDNYKPTVSAVTIDSKTYTVSTTYRLYYIDFDGKYGEKNGIYLKADCINVNYALGKDSSSSTASNIKIKALNPSLYKTGVTPPSASKDNMKTVTWLTNANNWDSLKTGASLADKVNYIVGTPSVEIMMDSWNTKYGLKNATMNTNILNGASNRVKLFYQYPTTVNSYNYGYEVGPSRYTSAKNGFDNMTTEYSVYYDTEIGSMYYPGEGGYCLASPSGYGDIYIYQVSAYDRGLTSSGTNPATGNGLCPLVSLESTAVLKLQ